MTDINALSAKQSLPRAPFLLASRYIFCSDGVTFATDSKQYQMGPVNKNFAGKKLFFFARRFSLWLSNAFSTIDKTLKENKAYFSEML